jgi:hypothetical protein
MHTYSCIIYIYYLSNLSYNFWHILHHPEVDILSLTENYLFGYCNVFISVTKQLRWGPLFVFICLKIRGLLMTTVQRTPTQKEQTSDIHCHNNLPLNMCQNILDKGF